MRRASAILVCALAACRDPPAPSRADAPDIAVLTAAPTSAVSAFHPRPPRARIDGRDFPDKVLALTWDDGPDDHTLELARFLHDHRASGTFFVVGAWVKGISSEPGEGAHVERTGYDALDVLGQMSALGQRIANHTKNHVILTEASAAEVRHQLGDNQRAIDAYARGDLRPFRAPGGAWSDAVSAAVDADAWTSSLQGPVHWDIDGKDWEGSLYCRADQPASECERAAPGGRSRVKPDVIARRYLSLVDAIGHGIVLFHDRVGHVGSDYALRVARIVVPTLAARGYVFAPVMLRFASPEPDPEPNRRHARPGPPAGADLAAIFGRAVDEGEVQVGDVDGDGSPDLCVLHDHGVWCVLANGSGWSKPEPWSTSAQLGDAIALRLGDINGDGRADACAPTSQGVLCAFSDGHRFLGATAWLSAMGDFQLSDVNGDGRADVCGQGPTGPMCAFAP